MKFSKPNYTNINQNTEFVNDIIIITSYKIDSQRDIKKSFNKFH